MIRPSVLIERALEPIGRRMGWERNYYLGVVNGWLVFVGDGFMNGSVVLSSFAAALGAPNAVIGLLPAIQQGGWLIPQLVVSSRVRHLPRKIVVYRGAATLRTASYALIVASSAVLAAYPAWLLAAFVAGMLVNALASGIAGLPFMEVCAKIVPLEKRTAFFGTRNLVGGLLALLAGLVVRVVLASSLPFPFDYTLIFALGTIAYTVGYAVFGDVDEPEDPPQARVRFRDEVRSLPSVVRDDRDFRAFVNLRVVVAVAALADPFFTVFALREAQVPLAAVGTFVITLGVVGPLSNALWVRLGSRFGSRRILRYALFFAALAPLAALVVPRGSGPAFALVFVLSGTALAGLNLGNTNHLLALARPEVRGRYIGVVNTLVGLASLAPVLGGTLADLVGYRPVFVLGAALYGVAWLLAGRLRRDA